MPGASASAVAKCRGTPAKDGPGGLRTLDSLRWLGKRLAHAPDFPDMVTEGLLDPAECDTLLLAEATLRRYRFALHLEAGRPEDGTDPKPINMAEFFVDLKPPAQWRRGLQ